MKKWLLVGLVTVVVAIMLQMGEIGRVVHAAPENPNAPVDLFDVETYYQGEFGAPGDPATALQAWIEVWLTQPGTYNIFIGIFDHQEYEWVIWTYETISGYYIWMPDMRYGLVGIVTFRPMVLIQICQRLGAIPTRS